MRKVLVTGLSGYLGQYLKLHRPEDVLLSGTCRRNCPANGNTPLRKIELETENWEFLRDSRPDLIIHAAAEADLGRCERDPEKAFAANAEATQRLARIAHELNIRLVFISTDIVFSGRGGIQLETDLPDPVNAYGRSKAAAESAVAAVGGNYLVLRLPLILGKGLAGTRNFIDWFVGRVENNQQVTLFTDEWRTPMTASETARGIWQLATGEFTGIVQIAGNERINRFELGEKIAKLRGYNHNLLVAVSVADFEQEVRRPRDVVMSNDRLAELTGKRPAAISEKLEDLF